MHLQFDPITLRDWKTRSIQSVFVFFVIKGCEGTKVEIQEKFDKTGLKSEKIGEIEVFFLPIDQERLDGARITSAKGKWIFTSEQVSNRCDCGTSFSFDSIQHPSESFQKKPLDTSPLLGTYFFTPDKESNFLLSSGNSTLYLVVNIPETNLHFTLPNNSTEADIRILVLAKKNTTSLELTLELASHHSRANIHILTLAGNEAAVSVNATGEVNSGITDYEISVEQTNLLLGENASIRGIPALKIHSHNGKAKHSATFESLRGEEIAYLCSRGMTFNGAKKMLLTAKISDIFPTLDTLFLTRITPVGYFPENVSHSDHCSS